MTSRRSVSVIQCSVLTLLTTTTIGYPRLHEGRPRGDLRRHREEAQRGWLQPSSDCLGKEVKLGNQQHRLTPRQEKELSVGFTIVNAQGVSDCKYVVGYYFKPGPTRPKFAEMWPKTPEENLERLAKDTGVPMEHKLPLCRRCNGMSKLSASYH